MEQTPLTAQVRKVFGRKVKSLRKEDFIPAHVFGHKIKTIHVQVKAGEFSKVFDKVGETGIVDLSVDGEKRPVLIRNLQIHPVTDQPLHIDFYQVNLTEKVKVNVPIEVVGESPAVEKKIGLLLTPVSEVEIEALPADIPEKIEIDISKLANVGDETKVKDLPVDRTKVEILAEPELVVVQIGELVTKEMEAVEAEIEAEQAEAAAEAGEAAEAVEGAEEAKEEAAPEAGEVAEEKPKEEPPTEEKPSE
ncbi:hypothetical protein A2165_04570 [Candidatus Curtissbacteria bacterium RBG_13_40_7]|uniref:Large ribosomal subunit protein bL25 n=1 Tax=Candidatus Curtissbacteria bacterium RBG_13_40_7 TaxID=1797706 RepID=A0A1F5FZC6_9BACT|nr:MAG: hypothetical protein A2165_04570 [Candidatus Curtissbacteria bacterium RBG_13_40_7]